MKLVHLSASRINTFEQCELKYHAKYERELPEPPPHPNTILGNALHEMFEKATISRMRGAPEAMRQPVYYMGAAFEKYQVKLGATEVAVKLIGDAIQWGYFRNVSRTVDCELSFNFELPDGTPVTGIIDRLDVWDDTADVIDLKTGAHMDSDDKLERSWQGRIYNIAVRRKHAIGDGLTVSFWFLRHQVKKLWLTEHDAERDEQRLMEVAKTIRACSDPKPTSSGLCKWCPLYGECPAARQNAKARLKSRMSRTQ